MDLDSLYYLLSNRNQSDFLNLKLSDFFREIGDRDLSNNRHLLSDIHGNSFFDLNIPRGQYFFDYWLINKDLNLFNYLNLISFDEVRSLNKDFFWHLTDYLSFLNHWDLFYHFFIFVSIDESISVFDYVDQLNLILFYLYRNLLFDIHYFFLLDNVVYVTLDLFVLWLLYYHWNPNLDLFHSLNGLVDIMRNLDNSLNFNVFLLFRLHQLLSTVDLYLINNSFSLYLLHNLSLLV